MSISSKISVLYLFVVLFSIKQCVCTSSSEADEPPNLCKAKNQDGFELKLRASLLFKKALILIDHNWFVYEVPYSSMNNSYSQLLIDIYAKPIEEFWPPLKTHEPWRDIKPNVISIYNVDVNNPFVYFLVSGNKDGLCFDLKASSFDCPKPRYNKTQVEPRITDTGLTQFTIRMVDGHVRLLNWKISRNDIGQEIDQISYIMGNLYYTYNRSTPNLKNISVINEALEDPSKAIPKDFGYDDLDWHLPPGFLHQGDFHFLDHKHVYSFPIGPLILGDYPGGSDPMPIHATNSVKITTVKDYFKCVDLKFSSNTYPPDPYSLDPGTVTGKSYFWIWIIVAIVLLLLVLAIIALLVWYFKLGSKGKDSKSRKHSSGSTARTRASSKKDNNFASKQKPSNQGSSKQSTSFASKQKPTAHKKK